MKPLYLIGGVVRMNSHLRFVEDCPGCFPCYLRPAIIGDLSVITGLSVIARLDWVISRLKCTDQRAVLLPPML